MALRSKAIFKVNDKLIVLADLRSDNFISDQINTIEEITDPKQIVNVTVSVAYQVNYDNEYTIFVVYTVSD